MGSGSFINKTLLYENVVNALYSYIDEAHIKPGEQFPPERELIEKWGISRNVLREAFHVLESRGVIVSRQGKGRFLREIPTDDTETEGVMEGSLTVTEIMERCSLKDAFLVRKALEAEVMRALIHRASDADLEELDAVIDTMEKRFCEYGKTVGEFEIHRMYAQKTGNVLLTEFLEETLSLTYALMRSRFSKVYEDEDVVETVREHRAIMAALKAREEEAAVKAMQDHIQVTMDMLKAAGYFRPRQ